MKKFLLLSVFTILPFLGFTQTFPLHDVDGCRVLVKGFEQNSTYNNLVSNPDSSDASVEVSSITSADATNSSVYFLLPNNIMAGNVIDWSARFYSASAGSNGSGSGQLRVQLLNNSVGAGNVVNLGTFDKVGGTWQTNSATGVTLTAQDDAAINAAGGFDIIRIFSTLNGVTLEDLFFDNIELSENLYPTLSDEDADLMASNSWIYNNRPGDNQIEPSSVFNVTTTYNVATPSLDGNSAPTVMQVVIDPGFSLQRYDLAPLDPPFTGAVKFRIYADGCNLPYVNNVRISLRKDNDAATQFFSTGAVAVNVPGGIWTEATFDLASLSNSGTTTTGYNELLIIFDQGDSGAASGTTYYLDALQAPDSNLSTNAFDPDAIDVFVSSSNVLNISGINYGPVSLRVFDIMAKQIMETSFQANNTNQIPLQGYSNGVYFVQIHTELGRVTKKIVLK